MHQRYCRSASRYRGVGRDEARWQSERCGRFFFVTSSVGSEAVWVALKDGRVVEARHTADAVYTVLRERGVRGATIMRVSAIGETELVGLGWRADLHRVYPDVEDHSSGVYDCDDVVLRPVLEVELLGPGLEPDDPPPRSLP